MEKTFEEYMQEIHASDYTGCDDNMPDDFAKWLEDCDYDDYAMEYLSEIPKDILVIPHYRERRMVRIEDFERRLKSVYKFIFDN